MDVEKTDIPELGWFRRHRVVIMIVAGALTASAVALIIGFYSARTIASVRTKKSNPVIEAFDPHGGIQAQEARIIETLEATGILEKSVETSETSASLPATETARSTSVTSSLSTTQPTSNTTSDSTTNPGASETTAGP